MKNKLVTPCIIALLVSQAYADPAVPPATTNNNASSAVSAVPNPVPTQTTPVDCNYHIPANQTTIDPVIITTWAEKAAVQSFNFTPANIQTQLEMLKSCYTEQGWKGFGDALQKSGNVESIKAQQLNVSSQLDGMSNINTVKDGQWKVTLPLQVVYQNDKEKVTQRLSVSILVGRKPSGDLGIMQLVATARPDETTAPTNSPTESDTTSSEQTTKQPQAATAAPKDQSKPIVDTNPVAPAPVPGNKPAGY
jgi:hypothetical protein